MVWCVCFSKCFCVCLSGCLACRASLFGFHFSKFLCVGWLRMLVSGHVLNSSDFRSGWIHFSYPGLSFDMHGASTLAPGGTILAPWEHPGIPWEQQGGHMIVQTDCNRFRCHCGQPFQDVFGAEDGFFCFCQSCCQILFVDPCF